MIVVDGLTKSYPATGGTGTIDALRGIDLKIDEGEVFGIVGPSGSGKSTLLRCLNLLERPTSGRILLRGEDLSHLSEGRLRASRRRIGTVFQQFNLLHSRTVRANVEFPLEVAGVRRTERRDRAETLLELVGLTDKRDAFPSQLSGGQQQRVGVARALAAEPDVLLCDEATSALDPATTEQVLDLIATVNRTLGVTIVVVTHELSVVRRICTSAALLDGGRIVESGPVADLVADPVSRLGDALLPAGVGEQNGDVTALVTARGSAVATPWLSRLSRDVGVDVAVVGGRVDRVAGTDIGKLHVRFDGDVDRDAVDRFFAALPDVTVAWTTGVVARVGA